MRVSKQVIVIRKDLNMRKGKQCAQASHASMKFLLDHIKANRVTFGGVQPDRNFDILPQTDGGIFWWNQGTALADWIEGSFTKIVVAAKDEAELLGLHEKAKDAGLISSLIQDEGRTEFGGVPTYTALAIGPAWADEVDPLTKELPLL